MNRNAESTMGATWLPLGLLVAGGVAALVVMRLRRRRALRTVRGINGEAYQTGSLFIG